MGPAERPSEDAVMLALAQVLSSRGTCGRLQVGAVLAQHGRPIASGYNGAPAGLEHCVHTVDEPCAISVHAETNAVAFAARAGARVEGATLYATTAPCLACSGLLINSGIARVVYRRPYRSDAGIARLRAAGISVERLAPPGG